MKLRNITLAIALASSAGAAQAAGPLALWEGGSELKPYTWNTSNGPIPVYTDGGGAFTYDYDGVTPFITIERANEITAFAFNEWNNVATSSFSAEIAGTIEEQTGIADVTAAEVDAIYGAENGYGFWVIYDTDGAILEDYFGVPRSAVLGIAFPEWADESTGEITEATALMNGWNVHVSDTEGNKVAGVFTHEFGHAINLSHSQVNGPLVYQSSLYSPRYPGVPGCVDPVHRWDYPSYYTNVNRADPATIETMFPFIDHWYDVAAEQSTIDHADDIAAISNLYPTADYDSSTGSISGVLRLKDGRTEYSGINIVARNVADPMFDAVSAMAGDQTQGRIGPDGRFTIRGLTPGADYVVYTEEITSGGYPTSPRMLISIAEYWNSNESSNPATDLACDATPITVQAGETRTADLVFNGYMDGIQYTPIVDAYLTDLAKNGRSASGQVGNFAFIWDMSRGFKVLPAQYVTSIHSAMSRNGSKMLIQYDTNDNGIQQAAIWSANKVVSLGDLNGDSCGGASQSGVASSFGWDIDDDGRTAIGTFYQDTDGDGQCQTSWKGEVMPFIWDAKRGMRELNTDSITAYTWIRGETLSGNGEVAIGSMGTTNPLLWTDFDGEPVNLRAEHNAWYARAVNYDGSIVAMDARESGVKLLNPYTGEVDNIGSIRWCVDMPYYDWWGTNYCDFYTEEFLTEVLGVPAVTPLDMNDVGTVIIGRAGDFFTGFTGTIWIEGVGWMTMDNFLSKQGVAEADGRSMNFAQSISASGREIVGTLNGRGVSWRIDMDQVYVCEDGVSVQAGFPNGLIDKIAEGAEFGRCEHLDG